MSDDQLKAIWLYLDLIRGVGCIQTYYGCTKGMERSIMFANNFSSSTAGPAAIATGAVGLLGLAFIILFFTVGQPFGSLMTSATGWRQS